MHAVYLTPLILLGCLTYSIESSNICGYSASGYICCHGWTKDFYGRCSVPICSGKCGENGQCILPDLCQCDDGKEAFSCPYHMLQSDHRPLINTASVSTSKCTQKCTANGYGHCSPEGECVCQKGYTGTNCQEESEVPCYLKVQRGVCRKSKNQLMLKRSVCCSAFNVAWGDPCERCGGQACKSGFQLINQNCQDINECQINGICEHGSCINKMGSFECNCPKEYRYDLITGRCVRKTGYCERFPDACGTGGTCVELDHGEYKCQCYWNFRRSSDKKKCFPKMAMAYNFCHLYGSEICQNGKCRAVGQSYECDCNPGYVQTYDRKTCKKQVNFCNIYHGMLCKNGNCINLDYDFMCQCNSGYSLSSDRKKCISYCDLHVGLLCDNGKCKPEDGGYVCECNKGYELSSDRRFCNPSYNLKRLEEGNPGGIRDFCSYSFYASRCMGGQCISKRDGYECRCLPGYQSINNREACTKQGIQSDEDPTNRNRQDMSFCSNYGQSLCLNGRCIESGSSYECVCEKGYMLSKDRKKCFDVNECTENEKICGEGTCNNLPGTYSCHCYKGFTLQYVAGQASCVDQNECIEQSNLCFNGKCVNIWGSYECSCNLGFQLDKSKKRCLVAGVSGQDKTKPCAECRWGCDWKDGYRYECKCPKNGMPLLKIGICSDLSVVQNIKSEISGLKKGNTVQFILDRKAHVQQFIESIAPLTKNILNEGCSARIAKAGPLIICFIQQT